MDLHCTTLSEWLGVEMGREGEEREGEQWMDEEWGGEERRDVGWGGEEWVSVGWGGEGREDEGRGDIEREGVGREDEGWGDGGRAKEGMGWGSVRREGAGTEGVGVGGMPKDRLVLFLCCHGCLEWYSHVRRTLDTSSEYSRLHTTWWGKETHFELQ